MDTQAFDTPLLETELCSQAASLGVEVSPSAARQMLRHLELVIHKNQVLNLTRIVDPHDGVTRHIVDSLLVVPSVTKVLGSNPEGHFLDIGTGAGFPGIPLALQLGMEGLLIDSVGKKVKAVEEFANALGIDDLVTCQSVRAEDLARTQPGFFSLVTARAVAKLTILIEYAAPLLAKDGYLVVSKANVDADELDDATFAAKQCGMTFVSRETYELPNDAGHREIYTYQKTGKPRIKLPRATGMAKNHPLQAPRK